MSPYRRDQYIEEYLRKVVQDSDETIYIDLAKEGNFLEFMNQQVDIGYIRNWFNFSFEELMAHPEQRLLQLYSYPELQQAVYFGVLIRELINEDYFVNMWSSLKPGSASRVLKKAAFEIPYRWHLMEKTKKLMMAPERQKRALAERYWWQVPRVSKEYERSRAADQAFEVFETVGGVPLITFSEEKSVDYDMFVRWLIGEWQYAINRNLIHTGYGFMGLGERFPDWRPSDMTFELKQAGAIWYVWKAMQYAANMWNMALSEISRGNIVFYGRDQETITKKLIDYYEEVIPDDPLKALGIVLAYMPSYRKKSKFNYPPTPDYGSTSAEGMEIMSEEIINKFYSTIDKEIFQRLPKLPSPRGILSSLIFTGEYSLNKKYTERVKKGTSIESEDEIRGNVPEVVIYGEPVSNPFNHLQGIGYPAGPLWRRFATHQEFDFDYPYTELPEISLNFDITFESPLWKKMREAAQAREERERMARIAKILHFQYSPPPVLELQNSLNIQDLDQGIELFEGVWLRSSTIGSPGINIIFEHSSDVNSQEDMSWRSGVETIHNLSKDSYKFNLTEPGQEEVGELFLAYLEGESEEGISVSNTEKVTAG